MNGAPSKKVPVPLQSNDNDSCDPTPAVAAQDDSRSINVASVALVLVPVASST